MSSALPSVACIQVNFRLVFFFMEANNMTPDLTAPKDLLFDLILYILVNNFSVMSGRVILG